MIKKIFTPATIAVIIWGTGLLLMNEFYYEYLRYYLYASIIIAIPFAILDMRKQKREDKINNTETFQLSIYRMVFIAVIMVVAFFVTQQNHI